MPSAVRLALGFFRIALLSLRAQTIEVTHVRVLIDEAATIRVSGCQPDERHFTPPLRAAEKWNRMYTWRWSPPGEHCRQKSHFSF
jgi:hypothetical protein